MNIYSSFIHHCQKLETTQIPYQGMDKQIVVYLYGGLPLSKKK